MMTINGYAFAGCSSLACVDIGVQVYTIGENAFSGAESLNGIVIPDSVVLIHYGAFSNCDNLTIYAQPAQRPAGWSEYWNSDRPVIYDSVTTIQEANDLLKDIIPRSEVERVYITKEAAANKYIPTVVADAKFITFDRAYSEFLGKSYAEQIYAKKTDISSIYRFKGTVSSYSELPNNPEIGDVYNVASEYIAPNGIHYPPGTNFGWDGHKWDSLGGDLSTLTTRITDAESSITSIEEALSNVENTAEQNATEIETINNTLAAIEASYGVALYIHCVTGVHNGTTYYFTVYNGSNLAVSTVSDVIIRGLSVPASGGSAERIYADNNGDIFIVNNDGTIISVTPNAMTVTDKVVPITLSYLPDLDKEVF